MVVNNSSYVFCLVVDADGFAPLHMILVAPIMVEIANEKKSVWNKRGCAFCLLDTYLLVAGYGRLIVLCIPISTRPIPPQTSL